MLLKGLLVRSVDDDVAGEAMAEGVEGGTFFAFLGAGTCGKLRVWRGWQLAGSGAGHLRDLLSGHKRRLVQREGSSGPWGREGFRR